MIQNPKTGVQCWIVVDIWETVCPVPVTIIGEDEEGGVYLCRWQITEEYYEDYKEVSPEHLYETDRDAWQAIRTERRIEDARKRNGILGGQDHG